MVDRAMIKKKYNLSYEEHDVVEIRNSAHPQGSPHTEEETVFLQHRFL